MRLNNKGFLITGILYSLLLLFLVLIIGMIAILSARQNKLSYIENKVITKLNDKYDFNVVKVWNFDYTGNYQTFVAPTDGYYKMELWGAQGGGTSGGKGAYTRGDIYLNKGETIYIYVGNQPLLADTIFNGGGDISIRSNGTSNGSRGGGSTDIRLVNGAWNNFDSLKSRIMVSAGGGGANKWSVDIAGGYGGALFGGSGNARYTNNTVSGATQTQGGITFTRNISTGENGKFGAGGNSFVDNYYYGGGGGSGYFGGAGGSNGREDTDSGSGGSSFVSGLDSCMAITEASTENAITFTGNATHYSGKVFTNGIMIAGNLEMPSHEDGETSTIIGNSGNGYARISLLKSGSSNNSIVVTYDAAGGKVDATGKEVKLGQTYGALPTPTREGYRFLGWEYSPEAEIDSITLTSGASRDKYYKAYAGVKPNTKYTIKLDAQITEGTATQFSTVFYDFTKNTASVFSNGNIIKPITNNVEITYTTPNNIDTSDDLGIKIYAGVNDQTTGNALVFSNIKIYEDVNEYNVSSSSVVTKKVNHTLRAVWEENS